MPNDIEKLCQALMASLETNNAHSSIPPPCCYEVGNSFEIWKSRLSDYLAVFPEEQHSTLTMGLLHEEAYEKAMVADISSKLPIKQLLKKLSSIFSVRQLPLDARYKFKRRDQLPGENSEKFLKKLRKLEFAAYPDSTQNEREARLLEQFTEGFQDPEVRKSFLTDLSKSPNA